MIRDGRGVNEGRYIDECEKSLAAPDLLRRMVEVHRGNAEFHEREGDPGWARYHRMRAEELIEELHKVLDVKPKAADPKTLAIAELGLPERLVNALEDYGPTRNSRIIWVRDLLHWTPDMVLEARQLGSEALRAIERALAKNGLKLREPLPGEKPTLPRYWGDKAMVSRTKRVDRTANEAKAAAKRRRFQAMISVLADGHGHREAVSRAGLPSNSHYISRKLIERLKKRLDGGESAWSIAKSLGFNSGTARLERAIVYLETLRG